MNAEEKACAITKRQNLRKQISEIRRLAAGEYF